MRPSGAHWIAVSLAGLGACANIEAIHSPPPAERSENMPEDRDTVAAVLIASTFQSMQRLAQAAPAEQAESVAAVEVAGLIDRPQKSQSPKDAQRHADRSDDRDIVQQWRNVAADEQR